MLDTTIRKKSMILTMTDRPIRVEKAQRLEVVEAKEVEAQEPITIGQIPKERIEAKEVGVGAAATVVVEEAEEEVVEATTIEIKNTIRIMTGLLQSSMSLTIEIRTIEIRNLTTTTIEGIKVLGSRKRTQEKNRKKTTGRQKEKSETTLQSIKGAKRAKKSELIAKHHSMTRMAITQTKSSMTSMMTSSSGTRTKIKMIWMHTLAISRMGPLLQKVQVLGMIRFPEEIGLWDLKPKQ